MKSIYTGTYFSEVRIIGFIIFGLFGVIAILKSNLIIGFVLLLFSAIFISSKKGFSIDLDNNIYQDFIWLLGFKIGKKHSFEELDCIFYKTNSRIESRSDYSTANTVSNRKVEYDAYIRFSNNNKIHLGSYKNEKQLLDIVEPFAKSLNTRLINLNSIS
ncbi:hypothetical protein [Marinigracilibium pacificum]|uniref:Uncharacterized protein n=1 Tax=Marinigracilibium pacificum TaxID=2729599 RepID=A0A848IW45_9BACT|nr:hypothetical protein [Marinigracilibium pacificum]NMM48557.1 hypothetical protein [Marinigracilibium pacificum]